MSDLNSRSPLQDEITDRLLMGQPIPTPLSTKIMMGVGITCLLALVLGIGVLAFYLLDPFSEKPDFVEWPDQTYHQYKKMVGTDELDLRGASHIYYKLWRSEKNFDLWMRMNIPPNSFDRLLAKQTGTLSDPKLASRLGPVRQNTNRRPDRPENWPSPAQQPPLWWGPETAGPALRCYNWEIQETGEYAKGWYWAYDRDAQMLWIWEWGHAHDLGWQGTGDSGTTDEGSNNETVSEEPPGEG